MGFESKFDACTVVLEPMTRNTFLLLISVDPRIGESTVTHPVVTS
jgi:Ras-related GTP-binding protein A/B